MVHEIQRVLASFVQRLTSTVWLDASRPQPEAYQRNLLPARHSC
jgi:hypothetical protein